MYSPLLSPSEDATFQEVLVGGSELVSFAAPRFGYRFPSPPKAAISLGSGYGELAVGKRLVGWFESSLTYSRPR